MVVGLLAITNVIGLSAISCVLVVDIVFVGVFCPLVDALAIMLGAVHVATLWPLHLQRKQQSILSGPAHDFAIWPKERHL